MAKKKDKPQVINNIQELNLEIDYDKLAEAIVRANFLQQEEFKKQEKEKRISNRMQAIKNMKVENYYDENSKPINDRGTVSKQIKKLFCEKFSSTFFKRWRGSNAA